MSSILESLSQSIPTDVVGQIGKAVGLGPELVTKGLSVVGPVITGALASKAATPSGLDSLINMLPSGGGSTGLGFGDLLGFLKPGAQKNLLGNIFGPATGAIGATLNKQLGFNAAPLLAVAAPVVMGLVSKAMHTNKLDKAGVAQLLKDEQRSYLEKGSPTATVVRQALDAGREAVAVKDKYTADEWEKVRLGPVAAAHVVMMASPSGLVGTVKEVGSVLEALNQGREKASITPTGLVNIAFDEEVSKDEFMQVARDRTPAAVLDLVRGAVAVVSVKNPADVASYKSLVLDTAQKVAEASKEGGFLGIGATRVSQEEQSALDQLRTVLNA
jgi:hypothetical protein